MNKPEVRRERIEETTVGDIDGWMVTVANVMRGTYRHADGAEREGISARVGLYDEDRSERGEARVGAGSVLVIKGRNWTVEAVVPGVDGGNGHIVLLPAAP